MTNKQKRCLIIFGSVLFIIVSLFSINESYYDSYEHEIMFYGINVAKVIGKGTDSEDYIAHIKRQLEKIGLEDVVVEISGENLYGAENKVFIEVTPPPSKLDRLIQRNIKPIAFKKTFVLLQIQR